MSQAKTRPTRASVEAFLDCIAEPERRADCRQVLELMRKATGAEPQMWGAGIVGFGVYHTKSASGREGEWPVIGFAPRKNDLALYLMPGAAALTGLLDKLGPHKAGKSCLYIKHLKDVDLVVLNKLIARSVALMAAQRIDV